MRGIVTNKARQPVIIRGIRLIPQTFDTYPFASPAAFQWKQFDQEEPDT